MKLALVKGTTSKLVTVFVQDSSKTDGSGLTGLVFNTASLVAYYYREGAASAVKIDSGGATALVTMTLGTWVSCGFVVVDGTNCPGTYSLGLPNAALAAGADSVFVTLHGAANMAPVTLEIALTDTDVAADWANGGRLDLLLDAIPTTAMRGTDSAATAAKLEAYVQLLARSDAAIATDRATELGEINANEGSGVGDFSNQTDAVEAIRDATLAANVMQIGGDAQSLADLKDLADTGYDPSTHKIQGVVTTDTATAATDVTNAVKVSAGTGAGQLDFTSGVVKSNLAQILGTALTETATYLAAGFKKLFNVASPIFTLASNNQTGDGYAKMTDSSAGFPYVIGQVDKIDDAATIAPATAAIGSLVNRLTCKDGNRTFDQTTDSLEAQVDIGVNVKAMDADVIGASELAADAVAEIVAGILAGDWASAEAGAESATTVAAALALIRAAVAGRIAISGTTLTVYEADGTTAIATYTIAADYSTRSAPA